MSDDKTLTVRNTLLEHEEETPEPYQVKNIDLKLLDTVSDKIVYFLESDKKLRPIDRSDALRTLGGIQGIGQEGDDFHNLSEQEQNGLLGQMYYAENLPQITEAFMVKLEYKPALPATGPSGPQLGFVPMGPGMGGGGMGMQPMAPQPPAPGGVGGYYPPPQQPYYPPHAYPAYPPQNYQAAPGQPPMGQPPYPPHYPIDPNAVQGQGYAQPHPYPSYPVPPQQGQPPYGYPPVYPQHPHQPPPAGWPPQAGHQQPGTPSWPPPPPVIIEAEQATDDTAQPAPPPPANDTPDK